MTTAENLGSILDKMALLQNFRKTGNAPSSHNKTEVMKLIRSHWHICSTSAWPTGFLHHRKWLYRFVNKSRWADHGQWSSARTNLIPRRDSHSLHYCHQVLACPSSQGIIVRSTIPAKSIAAPRQLPLVCQRLSRGIEFEMFHEETRQHGFVNQRCHKTTHTQKVHIGEHRHV